VNRLNIAIVFYDMFEQKRKNTYEDVFSFKIA